jgi:hypothetical protein
MALEPRIEFGDDRIPAWCYFPRATIVAITKLDEEHIVRIRYGIHFADLPIAGRLATNVRKGSIVSVLVLENGFASIRELS